MKWTKSKPNDLLYKTATVMYQAKFADDLYGNIAEYPRTGSKIKKSYELDMQIHEEQSITGITTNILMFSYPKLDFKKMEKDFRKIIKANVKKTKE